MLLLLNPIAVGLDLPWGKSPCIAFSLILIDVRAAQTEEFLAVPGYGQQAKRQNLAKRPIKS
jgi:predicted DNA-binding helix-hairpin-helix protein